ncbi:hypothetical protein Scep_027368 [Stephania cephalantha]|uniref:Uncharacterized protein n=1 Tax=Stephania cephalantha TaxID=152367 RepID=A0AAP0E813_9MAGN
MLKPFSALLFICSSRPSPSIVSPNFFFSSASALFFLLLFILACNPKFFIIDLALAASLSLRSLQTGLSFYEKKKNRQYYYHFRSNIYSWCEQPQRKGKAVRLTLDKPVKPKEKKDFKLRSNTLETNSRGIYQFKRDVRGEEMIKDANQTN